MCGFWPSVNIDCVVFCRYRTSANQSNQLGTLKPVCVGGVS